MRALVSISGPPCSGKTELLAWIIRLLSGWSDVGCLIGSFEMPRKVFLKEYLQVAFKQLQKVIKTKKSAFFLFFLIQLMTTISENSHGPKNSEKNL